MLINLIMKLTEPFKGVPCKQYHLVKSNVKIIPEGKLHRVILDGESFSTAATIDIMTPEGQVLDHYQSEVESSTQTLEVSAMAALHFSNIFKDEYGRSVLNVFNHLSGGCDQYICSSGDRWYVAENTSFSIAHTHYVSENYIGKYVEPMESPNKLMLRPPYQMVEVPGEYVKVDFRSDYIPLGLIGHRYYVENDIAIDFQYNASKSQNNYTLRRLGSDIDSPTISPLFHGTFVIEGSHGNIGVTDASFNDYIKHGPNGIVHLYRTLARVKEDVVVNVDGLKVHWVKVETT